MGSIGKSLALILIAVMAISNMCLWMAKPASAQQPSIEEVATSASISLQPQNITQGQPFTVIAQIYPPPPSNAENTIFYNIFIIVGSSAQGISGYGPWDSGLLSSDANGVANFTFPAIVSNTIAEAGGGNIEVRFSGQYFGNGTIMHYQAGDWQKNFHVTSAQTPTPQLITMSPIPLQTPFPTPSVPELTWLAIVPLFLSAFCVALLVRHRKTRRALGRFKVHGSLCRRAR